MEAGDRSGGLCLQIRDGGVLHQHVAVEAGENGEILDIFGRTANDRLC